MNRTFSVYRIKTAPKTNEITKIDYFSVILRSVNWKSQTMPIEARTILKLHQSKMSNQFARPLIVDSITDRSRTFILMRKRSRVRTPFTKLMKVVTITVAVRKK